MKKIKLVLFLSLSLIMSSIFAQTNEEIPGDNFSLEGALDLFKKSNSPEEFEKALNSPNSNINNLDLDKNGEVDYIKVIDNASDDTHAIALQAMLNDKESQDVAVIEIEKTGNETAVAQIIGDEDLFADDRIAEPFDVDNSNTGTSTTTINNNITNTTVVNVWSWPSIRFIYAPVYRPWVSPWRWRVYPVWWKPWRPFGVSVFRARRPVYVGFHIAPVHRVVRAHAFYAPRRASSVTVRTTHSVEINRRRNAATVKTTKVKVMRDGLGGHTKVTKATKVKRARRR